MIAERGLRNADWETRKVLSLGSFGFLMFLSLLLAASAFAQQYPNGWRGNTSGYWPDAKVPVEWDGPSGTNVLWKTRLPTRGSNGQPVFGPDKVLVTSEPNLIQCFSTKDGSLLWQTTLSCIDITVPEAERAEWDAKLFEAWCRTFGYDPADTTKTMKDDSHSALMSEVIKKTGYKEPLSGAWVEVGLTAPTPVATRDRVVVRHGSNVLACYDWDGKRQWIVRPANNELWRKGKGDDYFPFMGNVHIVELSAGKALVICHFLPDHKLVGMSEAEFKERLYPFGKRDEPGKEMGVESFVAFDLATGAKVWRSAALRHGGLRCNNTAQAVVQGETIIFNGGGDVIRAQDGKVVLRAIGWGGSGNAPAVVPQSDGTCIVAFNQGCRRWSPRMGHQVIVYRISRNGEAYAADKLWEWGFDGTPGFMASSPVAVAGKLFIGGSAGYVFDLMTGETLLAPPSPVDVASDKKFRASNKGILAKTHGYLNPIATAGQVFLADDDGTITVIATELERLTSATTGQAAWKPKVLAVNRLLPKDAPVGGTKDVTAMGNWLIATPQIWENRLYIRQNGWLWCIGLTK